MNITNERAIAQQLFVENQYNLVRIPDLFSDFGNHMAWYVVDGKEYKLTLFNFNYRKRGWATGLFILVERIIKGFKMCECGVRVA